ncbi:MAG: hypothetical protein P4L10_11050 [Acidobacteriaceae bacterium]|nr:hypothetical protein [Acidobacteriaceae bacterium]
MITETDIIKAIDAHLAASRESETAFGVRVAKDGNLVRDLRAGRSPRMRLAYRIMRAIEEYKAKAAQ